MGERHKKEKNSLFFIKHKFICGLTSANKKLWQNTEMHIKDLESVFNASKVHEKQSGSMSGLLPT